MSAERPLSRFPLLALALALGMASPLAGAASTPDAPPSEAPAAFYEQKIGERLPLDATVMDESGRERPLSELYRGKPMVVAFAYYRCPNLCTLILNGLAEAMSGTTARLGGDYDAWVLSIDPRERSPLALAKKRSYLARLGRASATEASEANVPWHFLTASEATIRRLTAAAGFHYRYDALAGQYAHPSGILVTTPDATISQYLLGFRFAPGELDSALARAGRAGLGQKVADLLLACFHYDPSAATTRSARVIQGIRWLGAAGALTLSTWLACLFFRERAA